MKKRLFALFLTLSLFFTGCQIEIRLEPHGLPVQQKLDDRPVQEELAGLTVHFIDVGQADCALIECDSSFMLIDGGNVDDGSLVVSYLDQMGVEKLDAVVCTHVHEDHVGGLAAVLSVFPTDRVYSPTTTYASWCFDDFMYYVNQQDLTVTPPVPGDSFYLGEALVTTLGPVKDYAETNDTSIVMKVEYGATSFLFTGDMERQAENDMLDAGMDVKADVLKVGHHGSNTSTGYRFLNEVDPDYAVISCGVDNSYGHPHREPMSRLRQQGGTIFRTDLMGTIVARSDGKVITFTWANQNVNPENAEPAGEFYFIGNRNSRTFHTPDCENLPAEHNRVRFDTYEDAVDQGYRPCGACIGD